MTRPPILTYILNFRRVRRTARDRLHAMERTCSGTPDHTCRLWPVAVRCGSSGLLAYYCEGVRVTRREVLRELRLQVCLELG